MGLTVTNTNTLSLLNIINRTSANQSNTLQQLSTGYKINKGSDNPAGLIAMESLGAEITAVNAALDNNQRADSMLAVADGALTEVSSLLSDIESLVAASASDGGLSAAEKAANQSQIDSAISTISRIANATSFNGKQLLNGAQGIQTTGVGANTFNDLKVYSRNQSTSDLTVTATVKTAATSAQGTFTIAAGQTLSSQTTVAVTGTLGTATVTIGTGSNETAVAAAINTATALTGVVATVDGDDVNLATSGQGSDEYVSATVLSGGGITAAAAGTQLNNISRTEGVDAVVTVNGSDITGDGTDIFYSANGYSLSFSLGTSLDAATDTSNFTLKASGGLTFQLGVDNTTRQTIGIDTTAAYALGGGDSGGHLSDLSSGGSLDLAQNSGNSLKVVRKAISDVATARGRIGGFQKFQVQTSINSLNSAKTSLTDAKSVIADTDYAVATSELNRQSVLLNSGISLLGLANQQAAQILSLLG
ncbi:MAG: hypothetical protein GY842_09400 [bacterium]|nr:hypothetical protein [bacterium]